MSTEKLPEGSPAGKVEACKYCYWTGLSVAIGTKKGKKKSKAQTVSLNAFLSGTPGKGPPSKSAAPAGNWADSTEDIDPSG